MEETEIASTEDIEKSEEGEKRTPFEKPGLVFFGALALVLFLVFLILFANVQGTRASAGVDISRHSWEMLSYADSSGIMVPAIPGTNITVRFGRDGRIAGKAGCNSFSAPYVVNDYGITIASIIRTDMNCNAPGVLSQEKDFLGDLTNASFLRISENRLNIYNATGKPVLVFGTE
jgi:heat shock protein HslJ